MIPTLLHLVAGCASEPPPPPEPEKPACDLTLDNLAGRTFVKADRSADGKTITQDTWARAQFLEEAGKLKVRYNTRALVDMYTYTCKKDGKEQFCLADKVDPMQYCQTLYANIGVCAPEGVAEFAGMSLEEARKVRDQLMSEVKKMSPESIERMKVAFSTPNNQLRGVFHVKVDAETCQLNISDFYQTMTFGQLREQENVVGRAKMIQTDKDLVFEHCSDQQSLVALSAAGAKAEPGQHVFEWDKGAKIPYAYVGKDATKAEDGCTYTMDTWSMYESLQKGVAVTPDDKSKLNWAFEHSFAEGNRGVVHMYRNKSCAGGASERIDVLCQAVKLK